MLDQGIIKMFNDYVKEKRKEKSTFKLKNLGSYIKEQAAIIEKKMN